MKFLARTLSRFRSVKCQWWLAGGKRCSANAVVNMTHDGKIYGRLCGAHSSSAQKAWPEYKYVERRVRKK